MAKIDVRDHGAIGDGANSDFDPINAAIGAAEPGDAIVFPADHTFVGKDNTYIVFDKPLTILAAGSVLKTMHVCLGSDITWNGGSFIQHPGTSIKPLMRIRGSRVRVTELKMDYGGNSRSGAYAGIAIKRYQLGRPEHIHLSDLRLSGPKSGITAFDCRWLFIGRALIKGADDAIVLKSLPDGEGVEDVVVSDIVAIDASDIFAIGDQVGTSVRRVVVRRCTGKRVAQLLSIRDAGKVGGGLIEDIVCSDIRTSDRNGEAAVRGIEIDIKGGTRVRGLRFDHCSFRGRVRIDAPGKDLSKQSGLFLSSDQEGSLVEDVSLYKCVFVDPRGGAPNDHATPGRPLVDGITIVREGGGQVRRLSVEEVRVDGVERSFLFGGCDDGQVELLYPAAFNVRQQVQSHMAFVFKSDGQLTEPQTDVDARHLCATNGHRVVVTAAGNGDPEGQVEAGVNSLWRRTDEPRKKMLYIKESGSNTTGWVAH